MKINQRNTLGIPAMRSLAHTLIQLGLIALFAAGTWLALKFQSEGALWAWLTIGWAMVSVVSAVLQDKDRMARGPSRKLHG